MAMLTFKDDSDWDLVERYQANEDGSAQWFYQNSNGTIRTGMELEGSDGEPIDLWAKFVELRDNGTITVQPVPQSELDAIAAEQAKQAERASKLNAFTFKGVSCSVNESDQNGWETVNARVKRLVASGEAWRDFPFFMDNGNYVMIESEAEWDAFVEAGWQAREAIMMARLSS